MLFVVVTDYLLLFLYLLFGTNLSGQDLETLYKSNRYYDPKVCRFINPDSINPDPTNAQGFNRYTYVYNNPLKYSDPTGHIPVGDNLIDQVINAFFGNRSRPSPAYRSETQVDFMSRRAVDSQNLNGAVIKLAAGAAVATRESETKTVIAGFGGLLDGAQFVNPYKYMDPDYVSGRAQPRSDPLFVMVELNLEEEPLYKAPYYAAGVVPATLILVSRFQTPARPRGLPEPPRVRPVQPRAWPRAGNRRAPRYGEEGYPPVLVGGAPEDFDIFPNPDSAYRYSKFEPGSLVHEAYTWEGNSPTWNPNNQAYTYVGILGPQKTQPDGSTVRSLYTATFYDGDYLPETNVESADAKAAYQAFRFGVHHHLEIQNNYGIIQANGRFKTVPTPNELFFFDPPTSSFPNNPANN